MRQVPIAVLASGRGSNLQALLDDLGSDGAPGRVVLVASNRPEAGALARAREAGIRAQVLPDDGQDAAALSAALTAASAQLVVLAGYLKKVPDQVVADWRGRMLNVHPALLPAFGGPGMYGRRTHEAVLKSGARLSGVSVHLVDEQYDHGAILAQWPVPVRPGDTVDDLAARVLAIEHRLLPAVVRVVCRRLLAGAPVTPLCTAADAFILAASPETRLDAALVAS